MNLARMEMCFVVPANPVLSDKVGGMPFFVAPKPEAPPLPAAPQSAPGIAIPTDSISSSSDSGADDLSGLGDVTLLEAPVGPAEPDVCRADLVFVNPYNTKEVVANKPDDVLLVQFYLNILMVEEPPLVENGVYSFEMYQRLKMAQTRLRTKPDGIISREGTTYSRLVAAFEPKKLEHTHYDGYTGKLDGLPRPVAYYGIYRLKWSPSKHDVVPIGCRLMLHVTREPLSWSAGEPAQAVIAQAIDVTYMPSSDLLHKAKQKKSTKLAFEKPALDLLARIRALDGWNKILRVQLMQVDIRNRFMWVSESVQIRCPVEPVPIADLTPAKLAINSSRGTTVSYIQDNGTGTGRILQEIEDDVCYFKLGRYLEVELSKRGFDCICYVGALYLVQSPHNGIDAYGASAATGTEASRNMASACGATAIDWTGGVNNNKKITNGKAANGSHIKAYFEAKKDQRTMLLFKGSHICLVNKEETHEFSRSQGAYRHYKEVSEWIDAMGTSNAFYLYLLPSGKQF